MAEFLIQNSGTIIVLLILLIIVSSIVLFLNKQKKAGKGFCGGNCENCPGHCHK